jgi:hypothetical protein
MEFKDTKKEGSVEFTGIRNKGMDSTPVFKLTLMKPVSASANFDIHSIRTEKGVTGIRCIKNGKIATALKAKTDVLVGMPDEIIEFVQKTHTEEIEKLKQEAQKDPLKWFWSVGGDSHQIYITPDTDTKTEFREDLKKIEKTLEKKLNWTQNPLREVSKKIDMSTSLYTETGWFEVPHIEVMKIYNSIIAEKEAKKAEIQDKEKAIFEKAKQTGEKQILEKYTVECSDPEESCDIDEVIIYAMPDGTKKRTQNHTW